MAVFTQWNPVNRSGQKKVVVFSDQVVVRLSSTVQGNVKGA